MFRGCSTPRDAGTGSCKTDNGESAPGIIDKCCHHRDHNIAHACQNQTRQVVTSAAWNSNQ